MSEQEINIKKELADFKRECLEQINKDRFKVNKSGYKFDRIIFNISFILILLFAFMIMNNNHFSMNYYHCGAVYDPSLRCIDNPLDNECAAKLVNNSIYCKNPFYKPVNWENQEYLLYGDYGKNPTKDINRFISFIIFIFCASLLFNHVIHNRVKKCKDN